MSGHTIMIVDETPEHRDILQRLLHAEGYRVIEATPGDSALDQAVDQPPDLILVELSLPGQRAWETVRRLSTQPTLSGIPLLGTTVYHTLLTSTRVEALGCSGYVEKPFDLDELLRRIDTLLSGTSTPLCA